MKGVSLPDLLIIAAYLAAMIGVGVYFARRRASIDQFTRASGKIPGWALGISLYATFLSSNTFLGVPGKAFGSNWNSFVFSLSMPFAAWVATRYFVPFYRNSGEISAYSHLERRFGPWARTYAMVCFLLTQLARMGAIFFGVALVLAPLIHVDIRIIMAVSGACIVIYTLLGGMEAVIWTEVVQGVIKTAGALLVLGLVIAQLDGGINDILTTGVADHKFSLGSFDITELGEPTFWVVLVYGFFINLTNFGIDQNYVQRYHTARTVREAARSVWLCVYCYVPVSLVFFFIGTALYTYYNQHPEAMAGMKEAVAVQRGVPAGTLAAADYGDQAMPRFMVTNVPKGLLGLILAALLSAAMSTISSGINSSATVILNDIYLRYIKPSAGEQQEVRVLQVATLLIAILALVTGVAMIGTTSILDLWWALSGAFAGGMLGLFLLGMLSRSAGNGAAKIGTAAGVLIIGWIMLSRWLPESLEVWRSPLHTHLAVMVGTLAIFLTGIMITSVKQLRTENKQ